MARISITAGATAGSKRRAATHYGPRDIEDKLPSKYAHKHGQNVYEYVFSYDDLPLHGLDEANLRIPANSVLKRAYIRVHTAFAGGASYNIGFNEPDGTVVDADGVDAAVAVAALTEGAYIDCDGALVGASVGTAEVQLAVVATGTFTAGKMSVVLEFEELHDRA